MSAHYYLMSQLPALIRDVPAQIDYARFEELASRFLAPEDLAALRALSLEPPRSPVSTGSEILDAWFAFERSLRLSLARARAEKLGRDFPETGEDESCVYAALEGSEVARAAAAIENPLDAERFLSRARFDFIENIGSLHGFDREAVFAYGLSLLLKERESKFSPDTGRAAYVEAYNAILGE
jgi:hypothetical protein